MTASEYCRLKLNPAGVVTSDHDELEGRFPAGTANLATSSLYYDALNSAVMLGKELGKPQAQLSAYSEQARNIRSAIEKYFGRKDTGLRRISLLRRKHGSAGLDLCSAGDGHRGSQAGSN